MRSTSRRSSATRSAGRGPDIIIATASARCIRFALICLALQPSALSFRSSNMGPPGG